MTKLQRAKIYRKAAEYVSNSNAVFGCEALCNFFNAGFQGYDFLEESFPEFFLFKAKKAIPIQGGWWYLSKKEPRILALLLSAEIALNP